MNSDFDKALDDLSLVIPNFECLFTSKDTASPKNTKCFGECPFNKTVQDMDVKFDMTTRRKVFFLFASSTCLELSPYYSY